MRESEIYLYETPDFCPTLYANFVAVGHAKAREEAIRRGAKALWVRVEVDGPFRAKWRPVRL